MLAAVYFHCVQRPTKELGYIFNQVDHCSADKRRLYQLLSSLFEKMWERAQGTDEIPASPDPVLSHMLSWPSFTRYLALFCVYMN